MKKSNGMIFIVLIPIIFGIIAFLYDNILIITTNKGYEEISRSIIKEVLSNSYTDKEQEIKNKYEKHKMETEQLNVNYDGEYLTVYNVHTYPSFFGVILGIKTYRTEVDLIGYPDTDNNIIIKNNSKEE